MRSISGYVHAVARPLVVPALVAELLVERARCRASGCARNARSCVAGVISCSRASTLTDARLQVRALLGRRVHHPAAEHVGRDVGRRLAVDAAHHEERRAQPLRIGLVPDAPRARERRCARARDPCTAAAARGRTAGTPDRARAAARGAPRSARVALPGRSTANSTVSLDMPLPGDATSVTTASGPIACDGPRAEGGAQLCRDRAARASRTRSRRPCDRPPRPARSKLSRDRHRVRRDASRVRDRAGRRRGPRRRSATGRRAPNRSGPRACTCAAGAPPRGRSPRARTAAPGSGAHRARTSSRISFAPSAAGVAQAAAVPAIGVEAGRDRARRWSSSAGASSRAAHPVRAGTSHRRRRSRTACSTDAQHDRPLADAHRFERAPVEQARSAPASTRAAEPRDAGARGTSVQPSAAKRFVIVAMCSSTTSPVTPRTRSAPSTSSQRAAISSRKPSSAIARGEPVGDDRLDARQRVAFGALRSRSRPAMRSGCTNASAPSSTSRSAINASSSGGAAAASPIQQPSASR